MYSKSLKLLINWVVPKHTEMTLYVLGLSLVLTTIVNSDFWDFIVLLWNLDWGEGFFGAVLIFLYLGVFFSISQVFTNRTKLPVRYFIIPLLLIIYSVLFAYEYMHLSLQSNSLLGLLLFTYHLLTIVFLSLAFFTKISSTLDYLTRRLAVSTHTPFGLVIQGTVITIVVFVFSYSISDWSEYSWALPITLSLLTWQLFEYIKTKINPETF